MKTRWVTAILLASASGLAAENRPRVFITDSKSWEIAGSSGGSSGGFASETHGGARPQTGEIIKTFGARCPDVIVNNRQEVADYVVLLDHEGGKGPIWHDNKVAVFNKPGDSIVSHSTRSLGNAVKDACDAIASDWKQHAGEYRAAASHPAVNAIAAPTPNPNNAEVKTAAEAEVTSEPGGADIEIDGNFVGSTPSTMGVAPGQHTIAVKKAGYKPWEKTVTVSSGHIKLNAELEKN